MKYAAIYEKGLYSQTNFGIEWNNFIRCIVKRHVNYLDRLSFLLFYKKVETGNVSGMNFRFKFELNCLIQNISQFQCEQRMTLLLSSYLSRIPTSPKCFSVGSCNFKLQYINFEV